MHRVLRVEPSICETHTETQVLLLIIMHKEVSDSSEWKNRSNGPIAPTRCDYLRCEIFQNKPLGSP